MAIHLKLDHDQLAEFCRRHHIRKLSFFGSVLRDDFRPDSDVDVLVELDPDAHVGLLAFARMEAALSELLGRKVDLGTPSGLIPALRNRVLPTTQMVYEQP